MPFRDLNVLDAAEQLDDAINRLIDGTSRSLIHAGQMRNSAHSICSNIAEGFGRRPGRDRIHPLERARGEAEETIRHLGANYRSNRIGAGEYWPLRNRVLVIVKMLKSLING
jgi:four helix bundle protein